MTASQSGVYPGAVPYPPPVGDAASHDDQSHPCHHEGCTHLASEVVPPRDVLAQRLLGGALMLALVGFTGLLWGVDGAFRILFAVYTVWTGFWLYALFVKRPTI